MSRVAAGPNRSSCVSQKALPSGVRIDQRMFGNRRWKKGAVRSTTRCAGSNQATHASPPSSSTWRKRTKAFILCPARDTFLARSSASATSRSDTTFIRSGSSFSRHSSRYSRSQRSPDRCSTTSRATSTKALETVNSPFAEVAGAGASNSPPLPAPSTTKRACAGSTPSSRKARAALRQPSKSVSDASVAARIRTGSVAAAPPPAPRAPAGRRRRSARPASSPAW